MFYIAESFAQQRPHYTQYILNNYIINPAVAGIENYTDVKISHRHQWVGIQDAPVTTYLTIHGPLKRAITKERQPQVFMLQAKTQGVKLTGRITPKRNLMEVLGLPC